MADQVQDLLTRLSLELSVTEPAKLKEHMAYLQRRAARLGCYYERFPKYPAIPDQIEHTEAFIDLLSDLRTRGGNKKDIAELQRELGAQMRKDDYGESEVSYRRSLARRIQRVIDATMPALQADISEWEDVKKAMAKESTV
ncbi:hypothetical protein FPSE5266_11405 [Fusarium pseudograminearum]|nr:hypothetical protein FPSE5266_11405 [Fusarium pseudograminearum]